MLGAGRRARVAGRPGTGRRQHRGLYTRGPIKTSQTRFSLGHSRGRARRRRRHPPGRHHLNAAVTPSTLPPHPRRHPFYAAATPSTPSLGDGNYGGSRLSLLLPPRRRRPTPPRRPPPAPRGRGPAAGGGRGPHATVNLATTGELAAVALMGAVFTSKTALTDVFKTRMEKA